MSNMLLIVAGICLIILIFGILKRLILIALVIVLLIAAGALTVQYTHTFSAKPEDSIIT